MRYSERLKERFKLKRLALVKESPPDSHPGRYPVHADPRKGQVYGGECNVTRCTNHHAVWFNQGTFGLYCTICARGINGNDLVPLCVVVSEKPSIEEMEQRRAAMDSARRGMWTGT